MGIRVLFTMAAILFLNWSIPAAIAEPETSIFYPDSVTAKVRANAAKYDWAQWFVTKTKNVAQTWMNMSDDELWQMMFSHTVERACQVWSSGYCPSCKKDVLMREWAIDVIKYPWKVQCPHCKELFPKNDFKKFYMSGLDEHGIFDHALTDKSLLFNTEHPDANDPLHTFGVDDGKGYRDGKHTWRFAGFYLMFGQWQQSILPAVNSLADCYVLTGDPNYAHKAGILLDRIADLYPNFDLFNQGYNYEKMFFSNGYVSYWQHAGTETRGLALAYDQVRPALANDQELVKFLSRKAHIYQLDNKKHNWADIKRNIEYGVMQHPLSKPERIYNNFPLREITITYIKTILGWPGNRTEVMDEAKKWLSMAVMCDGISGEKGSYTSLGTNHIAGFLYSYAMMDPNFVREMVQLVPKLHGAYKFHMLTRVLDEYNIKPGDGNGSMGSRNEYMLGFPHKVRLEGSLYQVMWQLYEATNDPMLVQIMYQANGKTVKGMPYDMFCDDPNAFGAQVQAVIDRIGPNIKMGSTNLQDWRLAILRSGEGKDARAAWLDYDSDRKHGHFDGMQIGLFAKGMDLVSDLGYPPVQYDGWGGPKFEWYHMTAAHNTVVVNGKNNHYEGTTTLWADGKEFQAVRASGPAMIENGKQYERTVATVAISDKDFYVIDIFRVVGGNDHAKFMQSTFGNMTVSGLKLHAAPEYGYDTLMKNFQVDEKPAAAWQADWKIEDVYKYRPADADVHVRYTDLTRNAKAYTLDSWMARSGCCISKEEYWLKRVMTRRQSESNDLASTFVAVIEPYEGHYNISKIARVDLQTSDGKHYPENNVALEITLRDGRKDYIVSMDTENPLKRKPAYTGESTAKINGRDIQCAGELGLIRVDTEDKPELAVVCNGKMIGAGENVFKFTKKQKFAEINLRQDKDR